MQETLGKRISANRKRLGLTQDQLAEKLGVTAQAVSKWENDQSCPDISILPKLSVIFDISIDELLGHTHTHVIHTEPVHGQDSEGKETRQEFTLDLSSGNRRRDSICLGTFVLAVGIIYLLAQIFSLNLSFWDITWPTALLCFGLFGVIKKFSFFSLGCALLGTYFLADKLFSLSLGLEGSLVFAILILYFGLSLLVDAFRKKKTVHIHIPHNFKKNAITYETDGSSFICNGSFCSCHQVVTMSLLERGSISNSFGEMAIDLCEIDTVGADCRVDANCSFGELKILVPRRYQVKPVTATAFADFNISGHPDEDTDGCILLDLSVNFGETKIIYV